MRLAPLFAAAAAAGASRLQPAHRHQDLLDGPATRRASDTGPLAAAMAHLLAERFTPGKTTFAIVEAPDGSLTGALAAQLRSAGFAVASAGTPGAETIRIVTDHGMSLQFPFGHLEEFPRSSDEEFAVLRERMRKEYAVEYSEVAQVISEHVGGVVAAPPKAGIAAKVNAAPAVEEKDVTKASKEWGGDG